MGILQEILKTLSLPEFYFAMFRSATPVLLTTLGAMISSRSGTSNIALEGTMLISAFVGVVVSAFSQSAWIGFLGAVLAGFIVSNILAYFILKLNSNAVISGIALNTFASGGTIFVLYLITGEKGASTSLPSLKLPSVTIPVVKDIPVIGAVLSGHHVLTYAALILVAVVWYMFKYTRLGMHIRAVGESPDAAESVGIPVKKIKYIALCLSGMRHGRRVPVYGICGTLLLRYDSGAWLHRSGNPGHRGGKCRDRHAGISVIRILPESCELSPELFDPAAVYPDDAVSDHYYCVYGLLRDGGAQQEEKTDEGGGREIRLLIKKNSGKRRSEKIKSSS